MAVLLVTYAGDAGTRFDRDYYVSRHLPLCMDAWGPLGLETIAAFFPADNGAGTIVVCLCGFRDEAAIKASVNSPQTARVMADVPRFTDAKPSQSRVMPL